MPVAMHLAILVSLFAVTVSTGTTTPFAADQRTNIPKTVAEPSSLVVTTKNAISLSTSTTFDRQQSPAATQRIPPVATSGNVSTSLPPTPRQTTNRTEEALPSSSPNVTRTSQTPNETVSRKSTVQPVSGLPNSTGSTTGNITNTGLSHDWGEVEMEANPGLVAVICMFCLIFAISLVVVILKCIQPSKSDFVDIEDVPLKFPGVYTSRERWHIQCDYKNVRKEENSPFAQCEK